MSHYKWTPPSLTDEEAEILLGTKKTNVLFAKHLGITLVAAGKAYPSSAFICMNRNETESSCIVCKRLFPYESTPGTFCPNTHYSPQGLARRINKLLEQWRKEKGDQ